MVAVIGIDAQLVNHLEAVLAPVIDVHQRVVQRRAVFADEAVARAQRLRRGKDVRRDDLFEQPGEFLVGKLDTVELLELVAEVGFKRGPIADIRTRGVLKVAKLGDQALLDLAFSCSHQQAQILK